MPVLAIGTVDCVNVMVVSQDMPVSVVSVLMTAMEMAFVL